MTLLHETQTKAFVKLIAYLLCSCQIKVLNSRLILQSFHLHSHQGFGFDPKFKFSAFVCCFATVFVRLTLASACVTINSPSWMKNYQEIGRSQGRNDGARRHNALGAESMGGAENSQQCRKTSKLVTNGYDPATRCEDCLTTTSLPRLFAERQCWALTVGASWFPSALRSPERALAAGRTCYLLLYLLFVVVARWFG